MLIIDAQDKKNMAETDEKVAEVNKKAEKKI